MKAAAERLADAAVVLRAALSLPRISRAVQRTSYTEVVERLASRSPVSTNQARPTFDEARRVGQLVNGVANRLPLDLNCVPRTLTTWYLLRRRGIIIDMPLGVRVTETGERRFHTWAELDGTPLNDRRTVVDRYRRFSSAAPDIEGWE